MPVAADAQLSAAQWDERRAIGIAPLARGGDSGKRMAANDTVVALSGTPERPIIELTATLGRGDSFASVLQRAGVGNLEARSIVALVGQHTEVAAIEPGTILKMTLGRRPNVRMPRPVEHLAFRARFDLSAEIKRVGGGLVLHPIPIAIDNSPVRIQGRVGESLYRSARAAGASGQVAAAYIRAIATKLSLGNDVYADARFDIIAERQRAETGEVRYGKLLFAGLDRGNRKTQLLPWTIGGRTEWFEASGVGQKRAGFTAPVRVRLTSGYGMRFHPILRYARFHQGVDYGAAHGTPVYAVANGRISMAGRNGGNGNYIRVAHDGGMATSYSHLSRYAVGAGERVTQGQVIGYVGSTGLSTGPHLHFQVYRNGAVVNPRKVSFASASLLSGRELEAFRARLANLLRVPVAGSN